MKDENDIAPETYTFNFIPKEGGTLTLRLDVPQSFSFMVSIVFMLIVWK